MKTTNINIDKILRIGEVLSVTGLSKSGVYEAIKADHFPPPLKIGKRSSGWLASEIAEWIADRSAQREV